MVTTTATNGVPQGDGTDSRPALPVRFVPTAHVATGQSDGGLVAPNSVAVILSTPKLWAAVRCLHERHGDIP